MAESEPLHILVADQDQDEGQMLKDILSVDGHGVTSCSDPGEVDKILEGKKFDIVIEGEGVPLVRHNQARFNVAYQDRVGWMGHRALKELAEKGIIPLDKDPVALGRFIRDRLAHPPFSPAA